MTWNMEDGVTFSDEEVQTIVEEISKEDIINEMLRRDMRTNGFSMVEHVMVSLRNNFRIRHIDMEYEKLLSESKPVSDIDAFSEIAGMWRWKGVDQACFSNNQTPGQVYRILVNEVTMFLFIEIDTEDPKDQPQTTAMKLWQDVTFGRAHDDSHGVSVATIRVNMGTARKDQFKATASNNIHRQLMFPGQIYTWMLHLIKACVYTIGNFIAHNLDDNKHKKKSMWTKVAGSDKVFDLHFVIGDYICKFPMQVRTGYLPNTKTITTARGRHMNVQFGVRNTLAGGRNSFEQVQTDIQIQKESYRPRCTNTMKNWGGVALNSGNLDADAYRCMKFNMYTDLHVGKKDGFGATINYFFVQRVDWNDINSAVQKIQTENSNFVAREANLARNPANRATAVDRENEHIVKIQALMQRKVRGMWYLQDMFHFLDNARDVWGGEFERIMQILFRFNNGPIPPRQGVQDLPDWNNISEQDRVGPLKEVQYTIYDEILVPLVAEMENMYHGIIVNERGKELSFATDEDRHWTNMKQLLLKLKEDYESKQLKVRTRDTNQIIQELPKATEQLKTLNLRDCLLLAIKETSNVKLEPDLVRYLEKYRTEYMPVFCQLVQCHSLIALHELATKYEVEHYREMIERALDSFGLTVQSEILYMLSEVAKDNSILLKDLKLSTQFIKPVQKPYWIRRLNGGYTFGDTSDHTHSEYCVMDLSTFVRDRPALQNHLQRYENQRTIYWKFLTQQDFYKGLTITSRFIPITHESDPNEFSLLTLFHKYQEQNITNTAGRNVIEEILRNLSDIYGYAGVNPDNAFKNDSDAYFTYIKNFFSVQLSTSDGVAIPLLFYTRVFFVCRHIALMGLVHTNGYTGRMWEESHARDRIVQEAGQEYTIQITYDGNPYERVVSEDVLRTLMYTECLCLVSGHRNVADDGELNRQYGFLLKFIWDEMENLTAEDETSAYHYHVSTLGPEIPLDATLRQRILYSMNRIDSQVGVIARAPTYLRKIFRFFEPITGVGRVNRSDLDASVNCGESVPNSRYFLDQIQGNLHKLALLMKLNCNGIMAEIENQIKLPMILQLTRKFSTRPEGDQRNLDTSIRRDIFIDDESTSRRLKRILEPTEALGDYEDLFSSREVWFRDQYENYFMSSFVALRDVGLFRHEPFRTRLFTYRDTNSPKYTSPRNILVCVAKVESRGQVEKLMVQVDNSDEGIGRAFQTQMVVRAYRLTLGEKESEKGDLIPLYLDWNDPTEQEIIRRIRVNIQGNFQDPHNSFPTPVRARVFPNLQPRDIATLVPATHVPADSLIHCNTWSQMVSVYKRAGTLFANVISNPNHEDFTVSLYHGEPDGDTMDPSTCLLWKELYAKCLLPHNPLIPLNVKEIYDDFVTIERRKLKFYDKLSKNSLPGHLGTFWLARDGSGAICYKHGGRSSLILCDKCSRNRKHDLDRAETRPDESSSILSQKQWGVQFTKAYRWKVMAIACMHMLLSKNILWKNLKAFDEDMNVEDDLVDFDYPDA